jgi:uracil-DNA glycosylase
MDPQGQIAASSLIESLNGWWELAGVESGVADMPVNWLELDAKATAVEVSPIATPAVNAMPPVAPAKPSVDWPLDVDSLKAMVTSGISLPGNDFGPRFVAPVGPAACEIMIISDLPDQDELAAGKFGGGDTGKLLARMLAAINVELTDCYWTALATTLPPAGEIPEIALRSLAEFVLHQIGLMKPKYAIVLGSTACRALLDEELMKARAELQKINHDGSNMAVLTTFHPRTLIARPAMKAQAWKDLQMFAKRAGL